MQAWLDDLLHRLLTRQDLPGGLRPLAVPVRWAWVFYRSLERDRAFIRAAGMAYASLVALVPLLLLVFGILDATGVLDRDSDAIDAIITATFLGNIPEVRDTLLPGLKAANLSAMGLVGIGGLLLVAGRLYALVEGAYNDIFKVENERATHVRLLMFYTSITLMPVVLLGTFLRTWEWTLGQGWSYGRELALVALEYLMLVLALKGFPSTRVRWRSALLGGLTTLVLLWAVSWGFRRYLVLFAADDPVRLIYGSLGAIPVFLLWLYLVWVVVLLGVEVAAVSQNYHSLWEAEYGATFDLHGAQRALGVDAVLLTMACFAKDFLHGDAPVPRDRLAVWAGLSEVEVGHVLHVMERRGLVARTEQGWLPTRTPDQVPLWEIVEAWRAEGAVGSNHDDALRRVRDAIDQDLHGTLAEAATRWAPELRREEGPSPPGTTLEGSR